MWRAARSGLVIFTVLLVTGSAVAEPPKIGEPVPEFSAEKIDGSKIESAELLKGTKAVVICFTCLECPVASSYEKRFVEFQKKYQDRGVKFVAISASESETLEDVKQRCKDKKLNYPFLRDPTQQSAKAFGAKKTPEFFVVSGQGKLVYHGSFEDDWLDPKKSFVQDAVDAILAGKMPEVTRHKAFGCEIRYRR